MGGKTWAQRHGWCVLLLMTLGCWTAKPNLKPPPHPEELVVPPSAEARFSTPPQFPKEAMNENPLKKNAKDPSSMLPDRTAPVGMGSGMGRGGY
jgi:hypothetical protein